MRCHFLFIIFALVLYPVLCWPQLGNIRFKHISLEQGLSNSTIECIFQDNRGFIWFGTRDGLNRFDGNQILVYRYNPNDTNSISDNFIRCISQDRSGAIWVGTSNGLNRFDAATARFTRFKNKTDNSSSISHNLITSICESSTGQLWIGTWGGLNLYVSGSQSFVRIYANELYRAPENQVNCLHQDAGRLWIGSEKGLLYLDIGTRRIVAWNQSAPGGAIRAIHAGNDGNLWL